MAIACTLADRLTVEIRDGETIEAALLRELRAATRTLQALHNRLIGDDETPSGERLRREVREAVDRLATEENRAALVLYEVLRKLHHGTSHARHPDLVDAVRAALARVADVRRTPVALLTAGDRTC